MNNLEDILTSFLCIIFGSEVVYLSMVTQANFFCIYENKKSVVSPSAHNTLFIFINAKEIGLRNHR